MSLEKYKDYNICIALPTGENIHNRFFGAFYNLLNYSSPLIKVGVAHIASSRITYNRNYLVEQAQILKATHMLFMDADTIAPPSALMTLIDHKKDIVCASTCHRSDEFNSSLIGQFVGQETYMDATQLTEATCIGLPLMLIKMEVFDKLANPYFAEPPGETGDVVPEDAYFCTNVRKAGYKIWCDMELSTRVGHVGSKVYQVKAFEERPEAEQSKLRIVA